MTTATSPSDLPLTEAPISSIQPGGGFIFSLEQRWGQLRRWYLRTCFPDYVERMRALRQGSCPDCQHDVIDSRDLKLVENVCGFSFAKDDDPYAWRNRLGLARPGLAEIIVFSLLLLSVVGGCVWLGWASSWYWYVPASLAGGLWLFILSFFRDPERAVPDDRSLLVSPADGKITHVEEIADSDFPEGRAFRISIFLSVFNVHVNRIPRTGTIAALRYYPGEYLDARHEACAVRNEQFWIDVKDEQTGALIRLKQVAGAIARRIVCTLKEGQRVEVGEHLGMIKFGSRTDVLLSRKYVEEILVEVGDAVHGASTPLLRIRSSPGTNSDG